MEPGSSKQETATLGPTGYLLHKATLPRLGKVDVLNM